MSLFLQIDTNETYEFFQIFDRLSPLRQKIWRKIAEKSRQWLVNKTCQKKIGEWCGCSRSAVSEAFKLFKSYGWMWLQSRGWKRSKIIEIPISKRQIDLEKKNYFHRVKATYRATEFTTSTKKINTSSAGSFFQIPLHIERLGISFKNKLKLSLVPESVYNQALETAKYHHAKGMELKTSIENYVVGSAIKMAEKMKLPLNWSGFYQKMKDYNGL